MDEADKIVRYCPECGHIGAVKPHLLTCCPDSCGMSMKRWQAEKLERVLDRARGQRRSPPSAPRAEAVEAKNAEREVVAITCFDDFTEALDHCLLSSEQDVRHQAKALVEFALPALRWAEQRLTGAEVDDAARLDFLDATNKRFQMGWKVNIAPAGNVSVQSIIMGGRPIREAIDAARGADEGERNGN